MRGRCTTICAKAPMYPPHTTIWLPVVHPVSFFNIDGQSGIIWKKIHQSTIWIYLELQTEFLAIARLHIKASHHIGGVQIFGGQGSPFRKKKESSSELMCESTMTLIHTKIEQLEDG